MIGGEITVSNSLIVIIYMEYKRKESFRHTLVHPIQLTCTLKHPERETAVSTTGQILDISPSGLCIGFEQALPKDAHECVLLLSFAIHDRTHNLAGEIVGERPYRQSLRTYGVRLNIDEATQGAIIEDLKLRRKAEVAMSKGK